MGLGGTAQLMKAAIEELQEVGVEPDIWKIEGIDRRRGRGDVRRQPPVATAGTASRIVVLGRGASDAAVDHWLETGSGVPGYIGFAIGRSIWWDPLKGFVDGNLGREEAAKQIAANYRRFIDVYNGRCRWRWRSSRRSTWSACSWDHGGTLLIKHWPRQTRRSAASSRWTSSAPSAVVAGGEDLRVPHAGSDQLPHRAQLTGSGIPAETRP